MEQARQRPYWHGRAHFFATLNPLWALCGLTLKNSWLLLCGLLRGQGSPSSIGSRHLRGALQTIDSLALAARPCRGLSLHLSLGLSACACWLTLSQLVPPPVASLVTLAFAQLGLVRASCHLSSHLFPRFSPHLSHLSLRLSPHLSPHSPCCPYLCLVTRTLSRFNPSGYCSDTCFFQLATDIDAWGVLCVCV